MMGKRAIILGLGFLLLAGLFSPLAAGVNDSLHVVMTVADTDYRAEDLINIQVRIFDKGTPVNLADIQDASVAVSTFNTPGAGSAKIPIDLTNQDTGVYGGSYRVKGSDSGHILEFTYSVTVGNDNEAGSVLVPIYTAQDTVDVTIGGQKDVPAWPGDNIKATVLVRTGIYPTAVSGFTDLYIESPQGLKESLMPIEKNTGIYEVNYTMPSVSVSGTYKIIALPVGIGQPDSAFIHVNVLDVWCHKLSVTTTNTVSFEVCVADVYGAPVEGAQFLIWRDDNPAAPPYDGITNASGRCIIHATNIIDTVGFSGFVIANGLNQTISGALTNDGERQPSHGVFDILWEGTEIIFKPNTQVAIPYGAYICKDNTSTYSPSKTIYYYVTAAGTDFALFGDPGPNIDAPREVVATGSVVTNEMGKFTIAFKTPGEQCRINVRLEAPQDKLSFPNETYYDLDDGIYYAALPWDDWGDYGFVFYAYEGKLDGDKSVSSKIGDFKPGKPGRVTVSLDAEVGEPVYAFWGIGESSLEDIESYDPEWMRWVPAGNVLLLQMDEKGKYRGEFLVPKFITDQDVTVAAGYVDTEGIPHFEVKTASPSSGIPWFWIGVTIIIIVVVIVAIIIAREKMVF
ncbi:MAG: hypothetical protein R6W91_05680 [Thermoplasmata archaeon]